MTAIKEIKRVLVVDDSKTIHLLARKSLEPEGYEILSAYDGEEGIQVALDQKPDVIILDIEMPKLDGFGVLAQLGRIAELRKTPVVMLTARNDMAARMTTYYAGVKSFLSKPFDGPKLIQTLRDIPSLPESSLTLSP